MGVTVPPGLRAKVASALVPASAMTRWPAASKEIAKGTAPGSEFTTGVGDSSPKRPTPNTSMSLPLALVVTISLEPSGREGDLTRCVRELRRCRRIETQGSVRSREGEEVTEEVHVALDRSTVLGVEDVDEAAVHRHAHRERATRVDHLTQREAVPLDREDRHGVAASVDRVELGGALVVGERSLRGQVIDDRTSQLTTQAARVVGAGQGESCRRRNGHRRRPGCLPCCRFVRRPT